MHHTSCTVRSCGWTGFTKRGPRNAGSFVPADKLPLGPQPSPMLPLILSLTAVAVGGYNLGQVSSAL